MISPLFMFEEITSSFQLLTTCNFLKGGDFMEREDPEMEREDPEIDRMISEGSPVQPVPDPKPRNSSFPERKGRIRPELLDGKSGGYFRIRSAKLLADLINSDYKNINRMEAGD